MYVYRNMLCYGTWTIMESALVCGRAPVNTRASGEISRMTGKVSRLRRASLCIHKAPSDLASGMFADLRSNFTL